MGALLFHRDGTPKNALAKSECAKWRAKTVDELLARKRVILGDTPETQSRALNPCGMDQKGHFNEGNTCAKGSGGRGDTPTAESFEKRLFASPDKPSSIMAAYGWSGDARRLDRTFEQFDSDMEAMKLSADEKSKRRAAAAGALAGIASAIQDFPVAAGADIQFNSLAEEIKKRETAVVQEQIDNTEVLLEDEKSSGGLMVADLERRLADLRSGKWLNERPELRVQIYMDTKNVNASYNWEGDVITIIPENVSPKAKTVESYLDLWMSSPSDLHVGYHESVHAAHYKRMRNMAGLPTDGQLDAAGTKKLAATRDSRSEKAFEAIYNTGEFVMATDLEDRIKRNVGRYATVSPSETVAEYVTGVALGGIDRDPVIEGYVADLGAAMPRTVRPISDEAKKLAQDRKDEVAKIYRGTQSRALNPCGQVAGGLFGPGNTCAKGGGPGDAPAAASPFQPGGPQPTGYKSPEIPPDFVGAGKSWAEVRKEHIKDFDRIRKRIITLEGKGKEKYLAALEWRQKAGDALEKWQEDLDAAYSNERNLTEIATRLSMNPSASLEEKQAAGEAMSAAGRERMKVSMALTHLERDMRNALNNYEKVKRENRGIVAKVLAEEVGRVLREDGGKDLEKIADIRRDEWEQASLKNRLRGDSDSMISSESGRKLAEASFAAYESTPEAKESLETADKFLRTVCHPILHHRTLLAPIQYDPQRDRAGAGYGRDSRYYTELLLAESSDVTKVSPDRAADFARQAKTAGTTYLNPKDSASTIVHEFGHQIEHANREANDLAWDFSIQRTKGSPEVKLKEKYPNSIYKDDEIGRADDFAKAFGGSEHSALYTGKRYDDFHATEIVSMGVEQLERDGAALAYGDPEYFDLIVGIVTGRALTQTRKAQAKARRGTPIQTGS